MPILADVQKNSIADAKLKQDNINLSPINKHNTNEIGPKDLSLSKTQLEKLKTEFNKTIDVFAENSSLFSRAATLWGKLPWWQKIFFGAALVTPMIVVALIAHLIPLLVISLSALFMYTVSGFFLNNHHKHCVQDKEKLKQGFLSFATILSTVIISLNKLQNELSLEIEKLHTERQTLSDNLTELHNKLNDMGTQISTLSETNDQLHVTQHGLESLVEELSLKIRTQTDVFEQANLAFKQTIMHTKFREAELNSYINMLNKTNETLESELKKTKQFADILQGSVQVLSNTVIEDKEQRVYFQQRLNDFLENDEVTLDHFAHSLLELESKLYKAEKDFRRLNEDHAALLDQQETQIERLELVSKQVNVVNTLNKVGLFPKPRLGNVEVADFDSIPAPI